MRRDRPTGGSPGTEPSTVPPDFPSTGQQAPSQHMSAFVTEQYLMSASPLRDFLERIEARAEPGDRADRIDAWRRAQQLASELETRERGCADDAAVLPLPAEMAPCVEALVRDPAVDRAFAGVPVMFGLIELDATMCGSPVMVEDTLAGMRASWRDVPDDPALAAVCLASRSAHRGTPRASFDGEVLSVSCDDGGLAWLGGTMPSGEAAPGADGPGASAVALHLHVGSMPPVLHALRLNGRLLLVEGGHRARVLRALGLTYVPCLISSCIDLDDVRAARPGIEALDLSRYFEAPRPPMLRDFDRPALVCRYRARVLRRLLRLKVEASSYWVP